MSVGWLVGLSGVQPEQTSMTFGVDPDKVTDAGFFALIRWLVSMSEFKRAEAGALQSASLVL